MWEKSQIRHGNSFSPCALSIAGTRRRNNDLQEKKIRVGKVDTANSAAIAVEAAAQHGIMPISFLHTDELPYPRPSNIVLIDCKAVSHKFLLLCANSGGNFFATHEKSGE